MKIRVVIEKHLGFKVVASIVAPVKLEILNEHYMVQKCCFPILAFDLSQNFPFVRSSIILVDGLVLLCLSLACPVNLTFEGRV